MLKSCIKRVVCAISGGVDSAVAALLLKNKGYEVSGIFMRNWDLTDETGKCSIDQDREDAKYVCSHLSIPFQEVDFIKEYWNEVFVDLLKDYENGFTPNPDILCNKHIKFDALYNHVIDKCGADAMATGHYARTSLETGSDGQSGVRLLQAADKVKDQTFFLSQVKQLPLQRVLFPIGDLKKYEVKEIAAKAGLEKVAAKNESMGICFIGSRNFQSFMEEYIEPRPGNFVHIEDGAVVGQHKGIHNYTLGQRALLGGQVEALYIVSKDIQSNNIIVAPGNNHPASFSSSFIAQDPHFINTPPTYPLHCQFRFQHKHPLVDCIVTTSGDGQITVVLDRPLRALTPGQYAVFYQGDECLGSARILKTGPSLYDLNQMDRVLLDEAFT